MKMFGELRRRVGKHNENCSRERDRRYKKGKYQ